VVYKGEVLPGPQPPILDRALFDAVQAKLAEHHNNHLQTRLGSEAILVSKIYDDRGHRMSPSHSRKKVVRYRYYLSLPLLDGRPEKAGSICRVPAAEIEHVVADAVRQRNRSRTGYPRPDRKPRHSRRSAYSQDFGRAEGSGAPRTGQVVLSVRSRI
jgi:site-specific DNA recombinase